MSVILKNSSNVIQYTFPSGCEIDSEPFSKRLDTEPKAFAHGGIIVSDSKISTRFISLHGIFAKATQTLMESELNSIKKAVYTEDLRLYATQNANDFYKVECLSFEHTFLGMIQNVEINIDFLVSDPFRYYKDLTTDTKNPVVSGTPYTVNNAGDVEVSPVISYTAGGTQSKVKIQNNEDAGKYFEYSGGLVNTDVLEIDCLEGTVEKNGSDVIVDWLGSFIDLASGDNTITITITGTSGTSVCIFTFRKKYL